MPVYVRPLSYLYEGELVDCVYRCHSKSKGEHAIQKDF